VALRCAAGTGIRKHPLFFLDRWRKVQPEAKEANHEAIMVVSGPGLGRSTNMHNDHAQLVVLL
jgi:hypothetical protein